MFSRPSSLNDDARRIIEDHLNLGCHKAVSYLPIATVEKVLKMDVREYERLIEGRGNNAAIFTADTSCIKSGAIYAFCRSALDRILQENKDILMEQGWPITAHAFVGRIASQWVDDQSPILPIIRRAFGDSMTQ